MTFLAITSQTWFVTGLGFGLVLVLLCVFVFIMKGLGALMQTTPKEEPKTVAAAAPKAEETHKASAEEDELAAVAMAIHCFYGLHDVEPAHITIRPHHTMWNNNL